MVIIVEKVSQRYQKCLITVAMGFRSEEDIKKNGLSRFTNDEKEQVINYVLELFKKNKSVLALKIKQTGYRSEHININSDEDLKCFIEGIDNIFDKDNEIWVVESSVIECWRGRIFLSRDKSKDTIEMAYSYDDHILDHLDSETNIPHIRYQRMNDLFEVVDSNLDEDKYSEIDIIVKDILSKYSTNLKAVKEDIDTLGIDGISIDVRVNNGYDFHDFDVSYDDTKKVMDYYLSLLKIKKR